MTFRRCGCQTLLHQELQQFGPHLQSPVLHLIEGDDLFLILRHHTVIRRRRTREERSLTLIGILFDRNSFTAS